MGRKRRRKQKQRRRPQKVAPTPKAAEYSEEPSSIDKRFQQVSPNVFKVGGITGGSGCLMVILLIPGVSAPVVMLLFRLAFGQGRPFMSWGGDSAILTISLGCQLFTLIALAIWLLHRRFVFDKQEGELTAGNIIQKQQYPLTAIQSVEVCRRSSNTKNWFAPGYWDYRSEGEYDRHRDVTSFEIGLILKTQTDDLRLNLSASENLDHAVEKAEQLAEFLKLPIGGDAYEKFKGSSSQ